MTKDVNLRIKADAMGLVAEDYETDRVDLDQLYSGHTEIALEAASLDRFRAEGSWRYRRETTSPTSTRSSRTRRIPRTRRSAGSIR